MSRHRGLTAVRITIIVTATLTAGIVCYLWFFTYVLKPHGELIERQRAPGGDLVYEVHAVNLMGAAGSTTYRVMVSSRDDSDFSRVLYDGPGPPHIEWRDEVTLQIGAHRVNALSDTDDVFYERWELLADSVLKWLVVIVAMSATALVAALLTRVLRGGRVRLDS